MLLGTDSAQRETSCLSLLSDKILPFWDELRSLRDRGRRLTRLGPYSAGAAGGGSGSVPSTSWRLVTQNATGVCWDVTGGTGWLLRLCSGVLPEVVG